MHYFIINQAHRDYETYSSSLTTTKTAEQRRNRFCKALQTWELKLMTKSRKRSTNWILITMVKWPIRTLYKASCWRKESSSSRRQLGEILYLQTTYLRVWLHVCNEGYFLVSWANVFIFTLKELGLEFMETCGKGDHLSILSFMIFFYILLSLPCFELLLISSIFVFNICLQALLNKTSICKKSHFFQRGMSCLSRVFRRKGFSGLPKSWPC